MTDATLERRDSREPTTGSRGSRASGVARSVGFKLARAFFVIVAATLLTQWFLERAPGGVAGTILGESGSPEAIAQLNRELGLDRPFLTRYLEWGGNVLHFDLGRSPITRQLVWDAIKDALPVSIELVLLATIIAVTLAIGTTLLAARRPGGWFDRSMGTISSVALAVPTFVLAPILLYYFAYKWQWFPVTGWVPIEDGLWPNLQSALLPAFCIALPEFAVFQRIFRADLVATLDEDYVEAARARGISESRILVRHAFRPASVSLMTATGISIGRLVGGTFVVEALFSLPGLGSLLQGAIRSRDLVLVQGIVVFIAIVYVAINLLVDVLYGVIDPRIRARGGR